MELVLSVVKKFIENGSGCFFYGGRRQETVDQALEQLKELYPDAKISGKISKFERYSTGNSDDKSGKRRIWSC